jgi:magnesium chelatase subunit I
VTDTASAGQRASAVELALELLYLTRRLAKDAGDEAGQTVVYGS